MFQPKEFRQRYRNRNFEDTAQTLPSNLLELEFNYGFMVILTTWLFVVISGFITTLFILVKVVRRHSSAMLLFLANFIIFLAGLQSISPHLYEVAKIEGATGYESFWKITFPMISPLILTNIIYSIIDSFTDNDMTTLLQETAFDNFNFGLSGAMGWMYFIAISIILLISTYFVSRKVFYQ